MSLFCRCISHIHPMYLGCTPLSFFRVCLFGGEMGCGWKTLERKWEGKLFWSVFGWVGRKENKWWASGVFSLGPPKSFLSKMWRKLKRKNEAA